MLGDFVWTMLHGDLSDSQIAEAIEDAICNGGEVIVSVRLLGKCNGNRLDVEISLDRKDDAAMSRIRYLYDACKQSSWSKGCAIRFAIYELNEELEYVSHTAKDGTR